MEAGDFNKLFQNCIPLFIALGDPVRLTIIQVLADAGLYDGGKNDVPGTVGGYGGSRSRGMNVKEITERTSLSRPAISHHLKILKEAGLIDVRREGTANYYYLTIRESAKKLCFLGQHLQDILDRIS